MQKMKKTAKILGGIIGTLILLILVLPMFIDVDKYRPQLVEMANQHIQGKLSLGKLKLSLWGKIKIEVDGLHIDDSTGKKVVSVQEVFFHVPFTDILLGSPVVEFKMKNPSLLVYKEQKGSLNVLSLVKQSPASTTKEVEPKTAPQTATTLKFPAILTQAKFDFGIENAFLNYRDESTGFNTQLKGLNLKIRDISLSRPAKIDFWSELNTQIGAGADILQIRGPAKLLATLQPNIQEGKFKNLTGEVRLNLDNLEILKKGLFEKNKATPLNFEMSFNASEKNAKVLSLKVTFLNGEFITQGSLDLADSKEPSTPQIQFQFQTNDIQWKAWSAWVPLLKEYDLTGSSKLSGTIGGSAQQLKTVGQFQFSNISFKTPQLKARPTLDGSLHFSTDKLDKLELNMEAPGSQLKVHGSLSSFSNPHGKFELSSSGLDLDQLINFPPPTPTSSVPSAKTASAPAKGDTSSAKQLPPQDFDALVDPVRKNALLKKAQVIFHGQIKSLKAYQMKVEDILIKLAFKDLLASIDEFSLKIWNGRIRMDASTDLKPARPFYRFSASVQGLDLNQAVGSNMEWVKNTLRGIAFFEMKGEGQSYNPDLAKESLKASGKMKIEKAVFATIDVSKMATEGLNKVLQKVGDKIPPLKEKKIGKVPDREQRFSVISSDFSIEKQKFRAPNFVAKSEPEKSLDISGSTSLDIKTYALDARWSLVDTYNLTKAKDLGIEQSGVRVEHILAEGDQPVKLPVQVGCTAMTPCYSYTEAPEHFAKVALANINRGVGGKAKAEVKKKVESVIQKASPAIQDKLKDLKKKFF